MTAPSSKRPRYHHGNLPAALVDAALALVTEGGAEALTLRAVAQRVGVSHAAPYRHFKDKQALVSTLATQGFRLLAERLAEAERQASSARVALHGVSRAYLAFAAEHSAHYRVMYSILAEPAAHPELRKAMDDVLDTLRRAMRQTASATLYWAQLHGLAALQVAGKLPPDEAASMEALATALIEQSHAAFVDQA